MFFKIKAYRIFYKITYYLKHPARNTVTSFVDEVYLFGNITFDFSLSSLF
jgi:hypothetical protein